MDGSASTNEDSYSIKIAEIKSVNWFTGAVTFSETRETGMILGQMVPVNIQLKNLWRQLGGGDFKCNTLYAVRLTTNDACNGSSTSVKLFLTYPCPIADAGPDKTICCSTPYTILGNLDILNNPAPNTTYVWNASNNFPIWDLGPVIVTKPSTSTFYNLTVTNEYGCRAFDLAKITVKTPVSLIIKHVNSDFSSLTTGNCSNNQNRNTLINCGNGYLEAIPQRLNCEGGIAANNGLNDQEYTYLWNTGETTKTILPTSDRTYYSCQVWNGCETASSSFSITVFPNDYYNVPLNRELFSPEAFSPNGDGVNDILKIVDVGSHNVGLAYHAYRYRLRIYNRWGNLIVCKEAKVNNPATGFYNGEIFWDGKQDGRVVPADVYKGQLTLWNCKTDGQGKDDFNIYRGESQPTCKGILWWRKCTSGPIINPAYYFNITVVR